MLAWPGEKFYKLWCGMIFGWIIIVYHSIVYISGGWYCSWGSTVVVVIDNLPYQLSTWRENV